MDFPEAQLKAAMVNFDYYQRQWNPNADFKEYYTARLEAHLRACKARAARTYPRRSPEWLDWPIHHRVEMGRCKLILEAIREREEREASKIRTEESPVEEDQTGMGDAPEE